MSSLWESEGGLRLSENAFEAVGMLKASHISMLLLISEIEAHPVAALCIRAAGKRLKLDGLKLDLEGEYCCHSEFTPFNTFYVYVMWIGFCLILP